MPSSPGVSQRRRSLMVTRSPASGQNTMALRPVELIPLSTSHFLSSPSTVLTPSATAVFNADTPRCVTPVDDDRRGGGGGFSTFRDRRVSLVASDDEFRSAEEEERLTRERRMAAAAADGYDAEKRRAVVQRVVDSAIKRYTVDASRQLCRPTVASKGHQSSWRRVPLERARLLQDRREHAPLQLGMKHVQIADGVRWLSKLKGDPREDHERESRRAAELANAQMCRRQMDERESERRLLTLSAGLRAEMEVFLTYLLDWASSAAVMAGRQNEVERELSMLEQDAANKASKLEQLASRVGKDRLHLLGPQFAAELRRQQHQQQQDARSAGGGGGGVSGGNNTNKRKTTTSLNDGDDDGSDQQPAQQQRGGIGGSSIFAFLREAARQAGSELTVASYAQIKSYFDILDADGGGSLSLDEIQQAARIIGKRSTENVVQAMKSIDNDASGAVDVNEIIAGVFFPHLSLSQVIRFERTHRAEIAALLDPRNRLSADDREDIRRIYKVLSKKKTTGTKNKCGGNKSNNGNNDGNDGSGGDDDDGCTAEKMLQRASPWMQDRAEIVRDAVALFDRSGTGKLSEEDFFSFLKFSYPPYVKSAVSELASEKRRETAVRATMQTESRNAATRLNKTEMLVMSQTGGEQQQQQQSSNHLGGDVTPRPPAGPKPPPDTQVRRVDRGRVSRNIVEREEEQRRQAEAERRRLERQRAADSEQPEQILASDNDSKFSIEALAEARWSVIQAGIRRPVPGHTTTMLGLRDLPPVDSVKQRFVEDQRRRVLQQSATTATASSSTAGKKAIGPSEVKPPPSPLPFRAGTATTEQRLHRLLGDKNFDARGNYSPDRQHEVSVETFKQSSRAMEQLSTSVHISENSVRRSRSPAAAAESDREFMSHSGGSRPNTATGAVVSGASASSSSRVVTEGSISSLAAARSARSKFRKFA